jgi:hypothetical protein
MESRYNTRWENVTTKNAIFSTLAERVEVNAGTFWADKTEFFMAKLEKYHCTCDELQSRHGNKRISTT